MGVGPDEMVDLEFLQDRTNERTAARAGGISFLERSEHPTNLTSDPGLMTGKLERARARRKGRRQWKWFYEQTKVVGDVNFACLDLDCFYFDERKC